MHVLLALVSLAVGGAFAAALAVVGRWAAGLPFGERSFRDAWRSRSGAPPPSLGLALARAAGSIVGWYLAGSILVGCTFFAGGETRIDDESMRVQVGHGGPAERAGIQTGDRVLAVDGAEVHDWEALKRAVAAHAGETVHVEIARGAEKLTIEVTPQGTPAKIMVGPPVSTGASVGIGHAAALGLITPGKMLLSTARSFARLFSGGENAEVSGPVGIVKATAEAQRDSMMTAAKLVAMLVCYFLPYVVAISLGLAIAALRRSRHATP
jgi:membrane-associated protease RseP (regulator of RpoE activity)